MKKLIYVNSHEPTMVSCRQYTFGILKALNDRRVPVVYSSVTAVKLPRRGFCIETANLQIFIFPTYSDVAKYGPADEAFYFDTQTAKKIYGDRYSERYGGWLIDYIVEVEGGLPRPEEDGKEFIHEYDT